MIDALAYEPHFVDHLAPVWLALPARERGRFITDPSLVERARSLGVEADGRAAPKPVPANPVPSMDGDVALVASYGDIKKGRRMGYGPFVFLEHGIGQSYGGDPHSAAHPSYSGGGDRADVILNLVPNEHAAARWRTTYPRTRTEVVGCPKLDTLPDREPGELVVAVSFHFPCNITVETRPAISRYLSALPALAERFTVVGHGHPRYYGLERAYERLRIPYVATFADVCRQADVYVCDNSSTLYEFAATGRPVVVLNHPTYRRNVQHGLRFWEAADVGVQVDHPSGLIAAVERALEDPPEVRANREAALDIVYARRSGAAQRAALAILSITRQAVAA